MTRLRFENRVSAAVTMGLALSLPLAVSAQGPTGPGLSSGSGAGTGTGSSSAIGRNPSGSISGVGPAIGRESGGRVPSPGYVPLQPPGFSVPLGPGATTTFPDDTSLFPFSALGEGGQTSPPNLSEVRPRELEFARSITDPGERCLTLHRIAGVAVFANQLNLAHRALGEAAQAADLIQDPITHDLRMLAIINGLNNLSEALLRDGKMDLSIPDFDLDEPEALPKDEPEVDRELLIRRAELEWSRAVHLANRIIDPTYRTESLYRVVESQSYGSQTIINEFPHSPPKGEVPAERPGIHPLDVLADKLLASAAVYAQSISRPVWRDRALVAAATAAAQARQFDRALEIARKIPQPEVRSDALMKIAESEARRNDPGATAAYYEAAQSIAAMPIEDPRGILAGVLVDSLISVGRFEDARHAVVLLPTAARRLEALGAVAESQGFRGASESAIEWITKEAPPDQRPHLYRKLRFGILAAVEQNKSRDITNRER